MYPATLTTLTALLAPHLPYLLKLGDKATEEVAKKAGGEAWNTAKTLWAKLRPKVEEKPAALEAVKDVAAQPDDEEARIVLRRQLGKLLDQEPELAREITQIMSGVQVGGNMSVAANGPGSVAIGGSVSGSTIYAGTHAASSDGSAQRSASTGDEATLAVQLFDTLKEHYNLDELKTLCFRLGVDYDSLSGQTKDAKARELVAFMERKQDLARLQAALEDS